MSRAVNVLSLGAWLLGFLLVGLRPAAAVSDEVSGVLKLEPNLERGRVIYEVCAACHQPEGWGTRDGRFPQIAGQHPSVIIKQLVDIREGRRQSPAMLPFAQQAAIGGAQALADVAGYVASLKMTPENGKGPAGDAGEEYERGKNLYEKNCAGCHGAQAEGNAVKMAPRLQGQHYRYLVRELEQIKRGERKNADPEMGALFERINDSDLRLIVSYVSRIPVPAEDRASSMAWRNPDFK